MAEKRKRDSVWQDSFEDISSYSGDRPRRPADLRELRSSGPREYPPRDPVKRQGDRKRPVRRPPPEWELPSWEVPDRPPVRRPRREPGPMGGGAPRPVRRGQAPPAGPDRRKSESRKSASRRPQEERRPRKPLSQGARRAMVCFTILSMVVITALLAIFLLFKVSNIVVTGDGAAMYQEADILDICGYKVGDNLFFLSTRSQEKKLEEKLPYVGKAQISRKFPGTVEISLTAAQVAVSVYQNGQWLHVSAEGKVLEKQAEPPENVLRVLGLYLPELGPGQTIQVEKPEEPSSTASSAASSDAAAQSAPEEPEEDKAYQEALRVYNAYAAFREILDKLTERELSGNFTVLDLSDLSHIRLFYQDRIEFQLGNILELGYKLELGCASLASLGENESGVMDLTYSNETKKATFTNGDVAPPAAPSGTGGKKEPEGTDSMPEEEPPEASSKSPRAEGIPDKAYTGEDSGSASSTGNEGEG